MYQFVCACQKDAFAEIRLIADGMNCDSQTAGAGTAVDSVDMLSEAITLLENHTGDTSVIVFAEMDNPDYLLDELVALRDRFDWIILLGILRRNDERSVQRAFHARMDQVVFFPLVPELVSQAIQSVEEARALSPGKNAGGCPDELSLYQSAFIQERLVGSREVSEEMILRRKKNLRIHLDGPWYTVVIFAPPRLAESVHWEMDQILIHMVERVAHEFRLKGYDCHAVSNGYYQIIAVLSMGSKADYQRIDQIAAMLVEKLMGMYHIELLAAIGSLVNRFVEVSKARAAAMEAWNYKFTFAMNRVINVRNVERLYNRNSEYYRLNLERVIGCFSDGNQEMLAVRMRELAEMVRNGTKNPLKKMQDFCQELTSTVLRRTRDIVPDLPERDDWSRNAIQRMQSVDEIVAWFLQLCADLLKRIAAARQSKSQQIVKIAVEYILAHIGDPNLSLQSVSESVDLSPSYFGEIFYKVKNVHISEFINQYRVEAAKEMLTTSNKRVSVIAEATGFSSPNYFNNVFKKLTGMTPNQYRNKQNHGE